MTKEIEPARTQEKRTFLHPYAGLAILGLDWLLFSGNVATAGVSTLLISFIGFAGAGVITTAIQRRVRDSWPRSLAKGLLGAVAVAVPFPILGTFTGGLVLAASGLDFLKKSGEADE
jgi:hypothetical protein